MHNSKSLTLINISLFKCCFFYLISYYKANIISINYKIVLKARKIIAQSCSMHDPGTQHHIWRGAPRGANILPRGFLVIHESFYGLEGSFHFPCLSLESTQLASIEFNSTICYWSSIKFKAVGLEFRAKWTTKTIPASTDLRVQLNNKHKTFCQLLLKPLRYVSQTLF